MSNELNTCSNKRESMPIIEDQKQVKQYQESDNQWLNQATKTDRQDYYVSDQLRQYIKLMNKDVSIQNQQTFLKTNLVQINKKQILLNVNNSLNQQTCQKSLSYIKNNQQKVKELQKKLLENGITIFNSQNNHQKIKLNYITQYAGYQIIQLDICLGRYEKNIKIYNQSQCSHFHNTKPYISGSFGNIYLSSYQGQEFAVKCIVKEFYKKFQEVQILNQRASFFRDILNEYIIGYIAGILQIGPKVLNPFGFDILMSNNCVQFYIEKCYSPDENFPCMNDKINRLRRSLFDFHSLNFVHNDIKPGNVMYSKRSDRLVFIDFGLSKYLLKPIGYKKCTQFMGTFKYCSTQMQRLLFNNKQGIIDLYYNDAFGLQISMGDIFYNHNIWYGLKDERLMIQNENRLKNWGDEIYLKYLIWQKRLQKAIQLGNIMDLKNKYQIQQNILKFINKIKLTTTLNQFEFQFIHSNIRTKLFFIQKKQSIQDLIISDFQFQQTDHHYKEFQKFYCYFENSQNQHLESETSLKQKLMRKDQKKLLLISQRNDFSNQKIYSLYLDFINFFRRNQSISIQEKSQVSQAIIQKFKIQLKFCETAKTDIQDDLKPIFQCLFHLLTYCFSAPFNKWKRNNLTQILKLIMILGWQIPKQIILDWKYFLLTEGGISDFRITLMKQLQFLFLQQIYSQRFFLIINNTCLQELKLKKASLCDKVKDKVEQKQSLYTYFQNERKLRNNVNQQNKFQIILIQILKLEENFQLNNQKSLNQVIQLIEELKYSDFKSKHQYNITKQYLWFWIVTRHIRIRSVHQKQMKLIQKSKQYSVSKLQTNQIQINSFQYMFKLATFKDFRKLKYSLMMFDRTINCPLISDNTLCCIRLILAINMRDQNTFRKMLNKISLLQCTQTNDILLFKHIGYSYYNIIYSSVANDLPQVYANLIQDQLEAKIDQFATFVGQNLNMYTSFQATQLLSQFLMIINSSSHVKLYLSHTQSQPSYKRSTLYKKRYFYLDILQKLATKYQQKEIQRNFFMSKVDMLAMQFKYKQLEQFLDNQKRLRINELKPTQNYNQALITITYYSLKIIMKKQENPYQQKLIGIYQQLIAAGGYNSIFTNQRVCCLLIKYTSPTHRIVKFFKIITEYVTFHPSAPNVQFLIFYFVQLIKNFSQFKVQALIQIYKVQNNGDIQIQPSKKPGLIDIYYGLLSQCIKPWQNPYLHMITYLIGNEADLSKYQMYKNQILVVNALQYLSYKSRCMTMTFYYAKQFQKGYITKRKSKILHRQLFKVTSSLNEVTKYIDIDIQTQMNYILKDLNSSHQCHSKLRQKVHIYCQHIKQTQTPVPLNEIKKYQNKKINPKPKKKFYFSKQNQMDQSLISLPEV